MEKELNSGIYIIENTINGKVYVGQSVNLNRRWTSHKSAYKRYSEGRESCWHKALWNAFDKYGVNNFEYKIIARCPIEYLNKMEIKFIQLYDSYNKGYNCDKGGRGGIPSKPVFQFCKEGVLIKKWDSIREACNALGFKSQNNIRVAIANKNTQHMAYGFIWSFENDGGSRAKKIKESIKRKHNRCVKTAKRKVRMYTIKGKFIRDFESVAECAKFLGVCTKNLSSTITISHGINYGLILIRDSDSIRQVINKIEGHRLYTKYRSVRQLSIDRILINNFDTIIEASEYTDIPVDRIVAVVENKRKSTGGFCWEYV